MKRQPVLVPLCALLSVLVLACGGPESAPVLSEEEALGTQEAALCSGLGVSTLTIDGASTYQGEMAGSGSWAVSGGANAVLLEYYVDGQKYASDVRVGTSGTWYFSSLTSCTTHTLLVKAYPMVIDSAGNQTTCWVLSKSISKSVLSDCLGLQVSAQQGSGYTVGLSATWSAIQGAAQYRVTHYRRDACGSATVVVYTTGTASSTGLHPNCGNPPTSCYYKSAKIEALNSTGAVLASETRSICAMGLP